MITKYELGKHPGCMVTVSGALIDLFAPDPDLLSIADIAHGLAYNCRWNGHTQQYWSVAQHCVYMADSAMREDKLTCLMHDAEEAYWGDMIGPLKVKLKELAPEILERMVDLRKMIFKKFGVDDINEAVKIRDEELLLWEFNNVVKCSTHCVWTPEEAKEEWLEHYYLFA